MDDIIFEKDYRQKPRMKQMCVERKSLTEQ